MYLIAYTDKTNEEDGVECLFFDKETAKEYYEDIKERFNTPISRKYMVIEVDENRSSLIATLIDETFVNYLFDEVVE